ncbi:MAG: TetR/AcrR family transcriptional regulator [Planctomycetes bacterium]|nr:TetR/AcrR family transcriptional regulator [Planctomycetota bacterium]
MPKVSKEHQEQRRKQIVDAAVDVFLKKGYGRASMNDICAEAELSAGACYSYYPSKDELVCAIAQRSRKRNAEEIEKAAALDPTRPLHSVVRQFLEELRERKNLRAYSLDYDLMSESRHNKEVRYIMRKSYRALVKQLAGLVAEGQKAGRINQKLQPQAAARFLLATLQGLVQQAYLDPKVDVDAYMQVFEQVYTAAFAA